MRTAWEEHVAKTRREGNRGKQTMSHRDAMKAASQTWAKEKAKLIRRKKRECKQKVDKKPRPKNESENEVESEKSQGV